MLWVSNHVSWTDIPLLGMLTPLSFLSKAEVRTWPVAGWLAAKAGSLFIRRGSGDSQLIRKQMTRHLEQAHPADVPGRHHHRWPFAALHTVACCRRRSIPK
jgi:1-acyl-sn-glycerol-3-phosphate acyltransferase